VRKIEEKKREEERNRGRGNKHQAWYYIVS